LPDNIKAGDNVIVSVEVQNTGKIAGDEVVQLYVKDVESSVLVPIHSLQGFKRFHLEPGKKQVVEFKLHPKQLSVIKVNKNDEVNYVIEPGFFEISVGGTQPGTSSSTTEVVTKKLEVTGRPYTITQ
jgi:beta-glucosidase